MPVSALGEVIGEVIGAVVEVGLEAGAAAIDAISGNGSATSTNSAVAAQSAPLITPPPAQTPAKPPQIVGVLGKVERHPTTADGPKTVVHFTDGRSYVLNGLQDMPYSPGTVIAIVRDGDTASIVRGDASKIPSWP